jgi:hypothetical protein
VASGGIIATILCCALGVGVLVRNHVAGVVGALVWIFSLQPLRPLIDDALEGTSIFGAAAILGGASGSDDLSWAGALLVLGVWAAVFIVAGLLVDARRDVD